MSAPLQTRTCCLASCNEKLSASHFVLTYEGPVYRPPSEADSLILQATIGCSWNHCTYCAMYRHKDYRVRGLEEVAAEIRRVESAVEAGALDEVRRVFVGDGDALAMPMANWRALLSEMNRAFPRLMRISCYATARNILEKSAEELSELRQLGLKMLYIGPESGDNATLKIHRQRRHVRRARRGRCACARGRHHAIADLLAWRRRD